MPKNRCFVLLNKKKITSAQTVSFLSSRFSKKVNNQNYTQTSLLLVDYKHPRFKPDLWVDFPPKKLPHELLKEIIYDGSKLSSSLKKDRTMLFHFLTYG